MNYLFCKKMKIDQKNKNLAMQVFTEFGKENDFDIYIRKYVMQTIYPNENEVIVKKGTNIPIADKDHPLNIYFSYYDEHGNYDENGFYDDPKNYILIKRGTDNDQGNNK